MTFSSNTAPSIASSVRRALVAAAATAIGLIGLLSAAQPAFAATIPVDTPEDDITVNGNCTLREAVQAANTDSAVDACVAGAGEDAISLPAGVYTLTLAGANEDANLTGDLDITDTW